MVEVAVPKNLFAIIGVPEDCAAPTLILCSNAGHYLIGVIIPVDGGMGL